MNRDDDLVVPGMLVHHEVNAFKDRLRARIDAAPTPVEDGSAYADGWHDALTMVTSLINSGSDRDRGTGDGGQ